MEGKTKSGFEFKVPDTVFNDYGILKDITALAKGDLLSLPDFCLRLLGQEQAEKMEAHCSVKDEDYGIDRIDTIKMMDEVLEIFQSNKNGKNS